MLGFDQPRFLCATPTCGQCGNREAILYLVVFFPFGDAIAGLHVDFDVISRCLVCNFGGINIYCIALGGSPYESVKEISIADIEMLVVSLLQNLEIYSWTLLSRRLLTRSSG